MITTPTQDHTSYVLCKLNIVCWCKMFIIYALSPVFLFSFFLIYACLGVLYYWFIICSWAQRSFCWSAKSERTLLERKLPNQSGSKHLELVISSKNCNLLWKKERLVCQEKRSFIISRYIFYRIMQVKEKEKILLFTIYSPSNIQILSPLVAASTSCYDFQFPFSEAFLLILTWKTQWYKMSAMSMCIISKKISIL